MKYHLAPVGAEFGPVADESFDNKEGPFDMGTHCLLVGLERKSLVRTTLPCRKSNNGVSSGMASLRVHLQQSDV